jgi:uncharacterized protein (TIGR04255 family)
MVKERRASMSEDLKFRFPPINEIGLSVCIDSGSMLDAYDIRGTHDLFKSTLPVCERQASLATLHIAQLVGGASNAASVFPPTAQRWWLSSIDRNRVLQIQDDFFSFNWRRWEKLPGEMIDYPGFSAILEEAKSLYAILELSKLSSGHSIPTISGCELLYDNMVLMKGVDGQLLKMSETLSEFTRADPSIPSMAWQSSWLERIPALANDDPSLLKVDINIMGLLDPKSEEMLPVARLMFTAGAARKCWPEAIAFFESAHDHIRKRFLTLIGDKAQAIWEQV